MFGVLLAFIAICQIRGLGDESIGMYRTTEQLSQNISALLQYPSTQQLSCSNNPYLPYFSFGNPSAPLAIIICSVHARELLPAEVCVDFANNMLRQSHSLLEKWRFQLVYIANLERKQVMEGNYCLRTNENKVDINRNFPFNFLRTDSSSETYGGEYPFSEKESRCFDDMVKRGKPTVFLDIHTGEYNLYYNHPISNEEAKQADVEKQLLNRIKDKFCRNCRVTELFEKNDFSGEAMVYFKHEYGVKYSHLFEIYGGYNRNLDNNQLCMAIFNPLTPRQLQFYRNKWLNILIDYFETISSNQAQITDPLH